MSFLDQILSQFLDQIALLFIYSLPVVLFLLLWAGLLFLRRLSMRGFEAAIAMDGATCLIGDDGRVVIRRRSARNIALLLVLGPVFLGGVIIFISLLIATVSGDSTSGQSIYALVLLLMILIFFLFPAIAVLVSSFRRPSVCFNTHSRMLETGKGKSTRRVSFSSISRIRTKLSKRWTLPKGYGESETTAVYALAVVLRDDEQIQLGTVSGEISKAKKRTTDIELMIGEAIGKSRTSRIAEAIQ